MAGSYVFLTPLHVTMGEDAIRLASDNTIQKHPRHDFKALKTWDFLIGEELLKIEDVPCWLVYEYEGDRSAVAPFDDRAEYAMAALEILAPIGQRGVRVICEQVEGNLKPRSVSRGHRSKGTRWSQEAVYPLADLRHMSLMSERIRQAVSDDLQRVVNPVALHRAGLNAENRRIRILLWTMALDALLMAANPTEFSSRLHMLLGPGTPIFPPNRGGTQPKYVIGDLSEDLYGIRSEVAHGRRISERFLQAVGFASTNGGPLFPEYTLEEILEEAALFILNRALRSVLTSDLYLDISSESTWRKRLKLPQASHPSPTYNEGLMAVGEHATELYLALPICRAEGLAELVPDFNIDLPYEAFPPGLDLHQSTLTLSVNTDIANSVIGDGMTEAEIRVEPGGSPSITQRGRILGPNTLAFSRVFTMASPSGQGQIRVRISGLRINALKLALGSTLLIPTTIRAEIAIAPADQVDSPTPLTASIAVARVMPGLSFQVAADNATTLPVKLGTIDTDEEIRFLVTYTPSFDDAFRAADKERSSTEMSTIQGTRLTLWLSPVPEGGHVFVTVRDLPGPSEPYCFQLTAGDASGGGPFSPVEASSSRMIGVHEAEFAEAGLSGTTHFATWECIGSVQRNKMNSFGVVIALPARVQGEAIIARGALAPISSLSASSMRPIPRFANMLAPITIVEFV